MTTALDIITDSVQKIGVYAPGETLSAADSALGLSRLNAMMDSWSNESLTCYANLEQSANLIPGQYQYTVGTGGNFNMVRPIAILDSPGSCYVLDNNGNRYNLEVVPQDRWNLIGNITQVNSNFPNTLFYDPQYPLGIINVYPVPNINWTLFWDSRLQLMEFPALTTVLTLPPGYYSAITDSLAVELWPYFKPDGAPPPQTLIVLASKSKGNVKRSNIKEVIANFDPEIIAKAQGVYNIYTDSNRGPV